MWDFFSKLSFSKGTAIVIAIMGCLLCPFLYFFVYLRSIFDKTDLLKLLVLSGTLGVPVFFLILGFISLSKSLKDPEENFGNIAISGILTTFLFSMAIVGHYTVKMSFDRSKAFFISSMSLLLLLFCIRIVIKWVKEAEAKT